VTVDLLGQPSVRGLTMQQLCIAFPIQAGKTQALKELVKTITESRWTEYEDFQKRSRVHKVTWFLQSSAHGDQFLIYNEGEDFARLSSEFSESTHAFDVWFGQQLQEITGVDVRAFDASRLPQQLLTFGY
jgi:hypothetical protein